jgi:DhnA family fructose-bisphosphate aldolase class Ia
LKIPYNGPQALEELVTYDPHLVVGVLGGSAGTTRDAFQLIHDAKKYGARVALYGRKINLSEHPLAFIVFLRRIVDGEITPAEAVKAYHNELKQTGIQPQRPLEADLQMGGNLKSYG